MTNINEAIATRLGIDLRAVAIAAVVGAFLVVTIPARWFFDVTGLSVVQDDTGEIVVIQSRRVWPTHMLHVDWTAQIEQLQPGGHGREPTGRILCHGNGASTVRDDEYVRVAMSVRDWVGDEDSALPVEEPLIFEASWSFRLFGLRKTVSRRSPVVVLGAPAG